MKRILLALLLLYSIGIKAQLTTLLDTTFNHTGYKVQFENAFVGLACADVSVTGELIGIYRIGAFSSTIFKYTASGQMDTSFANNGLQVIATPAFSPFLDTAVAYISPVDLKIVPGNKFLISWNIESSGTPYHQRMVLLRYNADGSLDSTFANNGGFSFGPYNSFTRSSAKSMVIQNDGKIVLMSRLSTNQQPSPYATAIIRLTPNGQLDTSFNTTGYNVLNNFRPTWIEVNNQGDILMPYYRVSTLTFDTIALVKVNSSGISQGSTDVYFIDFAATSIIVENFDIDSNDKLVFLENDYDSNSNSSLRCFRLNTNLTVDTAFGGSDGVYYNPNGASLYRSNIKCDSNGNTYLSCVHFKSWYINDTLHYLSRALLLKYNSAGGLDNSFGTNGQYFLENSTETDYNSDTHVYFVDQNNKIMYTGGVWVVDSSGLNGSGTFTVARIFNDALALGLIDNPTLTQSILAYPNPIQNGALNLSYELTNKQDVAIDLYDIKGQLITRLMPRQSRPKGENTETLMLPQSLSAGQYILHITAGNYQIGVQVV